MLICGIIYHHHHYHQCIPTHSHNNVKERERGRETLSNYLKLVKLFLLPPMLTKHSWREPFERRRWWEKSIKIPSSNVIKFPCRLSATMRNFLCKFLSRMCLRVLREPFLVDPLRDLKFKFYIHCEDFQFWKFIGKFLWSFWGVFLWTFEDFVLFNKFYFFLKFEFNLFRILFFKSFYDLIFLVFFFISFFEILYDKSASGMKITGNF